MRNEWDATWVSNATALSVWAAGQIVLFVFEMSLSAGRVVSGAGTEGMMHDTAPSLPARPAATSPDFHATLSARPLRSRLRASMRGRMVAIWVACCQSRLRTSYTWRETVVGEGGRGGDAKENVTYEERS
jgi:hypothetical protein